MSVVTYPTEGECQQKSILTERPMTSLKKQLCQVKTLQYCPVELNRALAKWNRVVKAGKILGFLFGHIHRDCHLTVGLCQ